MVDQDAVRRTFEIFELAAFERPEEGCKPAEPHEQRDRKEDGDAGHRAALASRSEFAMTMIELVDIATATSNGVIR
jgi:hypothetical protein